MTNNLRMTEKTRGKLQAFDQFELTADDLKEIENIISLHRTKDQFTAEGHGVEDEGSVSKIIRLLEGLPAGDLNTIERWIMEDIFDVSRECFDRDRREVVCPEGYQAARNLLEHKRGFLVSNLREVARRREQTGRGNRHSYEVREREQTYRLIYYFFITSKGVAPTEAPTGWFTQFMKILAKDSNYRHLNLYLEDPKNLIGKIKNPPWKD